MLIEKYKPLTLDDMVINDNLKQQLKTCLENKSLSNIILCGDNGVGKSLLCDILLKKLYEGQNEVEYIFSIDMMNDLGININEPLLSFNQKKIDPKESQTIYKTIYVSECDNLDEKIQKIINNIMSCHEKNKLLITCNEIGNILDGLQSKCIIINMNDIDKTKIIEKIREICEKENFNYHENSFNYLVELYKNDIRKIIQTIEHVMSLYNELTVNNINKILNLPKNNDFVQLFNYIKNKDVDNIIDMIVLFENNGYYAEDIMHYFYMFIVSTDLIDEERVRIDYIEKLSKILFNVNSSYTLNYLQLTSYLLNAID